MDGLCSDCKYIEIPNLINSKVKIFSKVSSCPKCLTIQERDVLVDRERTVAKTKEILICAEMDRILRDQAIASLKAKGELA